MTSFAHYKDAVRALFPDAAIAAAKAHARAEFPKESCGFIAGGVYHPCTNEAGTPEEHFRIAPEAMLGHDIEAIVHSHPNGPIYPSAHDMRQQIVTDVPWIIVPLNAETFDELVIWGDTLPPAPLLERPFVWGVFDCYALVRDYYAQEHGLILPPVPREDGYWERGEDLYGDYLKTIGFQTIDYTEARPGDGFLVNLSPARSPVPTHAGVLVEGGLVLHHLPNRLSRREPAGLWARGADRWVRHPELNQS